MFIFGGPRLPLGFRLGFGFDPAVLWTKVRSPARSQEGSFIYVIRDPLGNSKLGVSRNPIERLRDLQTGHPERLELAWCAVTPGSGYAIENLVKRTGGLLRMSGEWFRAFPSEISVAVMAAARVLGEPIMPVPVDYVPRIVELAGTIPDDPPPVAPFYLRRPFAFVALVALVGTIVGAALLHHYRL